MSNNTETIRADFVRISSGFNTQITGKLYLNNINMNEVVENAPPSLDTIKEIADGIIATAADIQSNYLNKNTNVQQTIQANVVINSNLQVNRDLYAQQVFQSGFLLIPAGTIVQFAAFNAPAGWLICDGAAVSRSTYAALFSAIATDYGVGNGSTTFNLPNFRGRVPVCLGTDTEFNSMGETGGSKTHTLTTAQMPSHTHTGSTNAGEGEHNHTSNANGGTSSQGLAYFTGSNTPGSLDSTGTEIDCTATTALQIYNAGSAHTHTFTTSSVGSGQSFNIIQPYIVVQFIIKY